MSLCSAWATEADLCEPCNSYDAAVDFTPYLTAASEVLYQLSAQQFPGICDIELQPCVTRHSSNWSWATFSGSRWNTFPFPVCTCHSKDTCSCDAFSAISLAPTPVTEVTEVIVDGAAFLSYELVDSSTLLRTDDESWPCCDSTFQVAFSYGRDPPQLGIQAAATLACELYLSCQPEDVAKRCRLPRNVVSVSRQGVSVVIANAANLFQRFPGQPIRTGLWEVDLFLSTYAPFGQTTQSVVLSPDIPEVGRRIGP